MSSDVNFKGARWRSSTDHNTRSSLEMEIAYGLVIVHDARPLLYYELTNQIPSSTSPYHCLRISSRNSRLGKTIDNIERAEKKRHVMAYVQYLVYQDDLPVNRTVDQWNHFSFSRIIIHNKELRRILFF